MLIKDIANSIKNELEKLNKTINSYSSDIDSLLYKKSNLEYEISKLNNQKSFIEEKIISKESELKQFTENSKEYTILELINLQKKMFKY